MEGCIYMLVKLEKKLLIVMIRPENTLSNISIVLAFSNWVPYAPMLAGEKE